VFDGALWGPRGSGAGQKSKDDAQTIGWQFKFGVGNNPIKGAETF